MATVAEMLDIYAIASARTAQYRWAQLTPGPRIVRDDVIRILDQEGQAFAVVLSLNWVWCRWANWRPAPPTGSWRTGLTGRRSRAGGLRTRSGLSRAAVEPLSPIPPDEEVPTPDFSGSPPASFYDWFRRQAPGAFQAPTVAPGPGT